MSEWLNYVKAYAAKHEISYKQALRDASPSYKTRNEVKPQVIKQEPEKQRSSFMSRSDEKPKQEKTKRNNNKKSGW